PPSGRMKIRGVASLKSGTYRRPHMRASAGPAWKNVTLAVSLSALAALAFEGRALAEGEKPVAVLTVHTTDAFDQADGLTAALKRAITQTPGFTLADGEFPSVDVLIMSLQCGPDPES